jgi:hypothetical protein
LAVALPVLISLPVLIALKLDENLLPCTDAGREGPWGTPEKVRVSSVGVRVAAVSVLAFTDI